MTGLGARACRAIFEYALGFQRCNWTRTGEFPRGFQRAYVDNVVEAVRCVGVCLVGAVLGLMLTGRFHDALDARTGPHRTPLAKRKGMSAL